jgi:hypothetical protein
MDSSFTADISTFQRIMISDEISSNSTMTTLPQDTQDNRRPIKLSLENSGGPECLNLSITILTVALPAKPPKYTLEHTFHYSLIKYPLAFGNL